MLTIDPYELINNIRFNTYKNKVILKNDKFIINLLEIKYFSFLYPILVSIMLNL